ncbi:MAG: GNAT family N-acetyltransferase [Thermoproteota archaeon]
MSAEDVVVREVRSEDFSHLVEFFARLKTINEELDPMYITVADLRETIEKYVRESLGKEDVVLLVAEHNGSVVGALRAAVVDRIFYEPRLEGLITDLYVHPSYRRKGVAEKLIERLEEILAQRGIELIAAEYPPGNRIANKFYEKLGFRPLLVRVYRKVRGTR